MRNYKREYKKFQSSQKEKKHRAMRNKARRQSGLKKGDNREVDHRKPLSKGGSNSKSNRRIVSRAYNRRKGKK
jgi:5-methylcytosine-specific restriction endonuclease McrA